MKTNAEKLAALRAELKKRGLDGFIVPRMSEYQGEFVADYAERLAWLTGFTGSAGTAAILPRKAAILTDGRYTIQLVQQADKKLYEFVNSQKTSMAQWLARNAEAGMTIGYDPWLLTTAQVERLEKILAEKSVNLESLKTNPVDKIWVKRPAFPMKKAEIFPEKFAGASSSRKRQKMAQSLRKKKLTACIITLPDSLAWLLNIRGSDVEHTPVVLSFGILHQNARVEWFVHPEKITLDIKKHLGKNVEIVRPDKISERIAALKKKKTGLDFARAPIWFRQALGEAAVDFKDPCIDPKAIKNPAEQKALREAHVKDGVAVVNFLYWLDNYKGSLSEMDVAGRLEAFRKKEKSYRGPSFATIAGWGANGAIVHYRATPETNKKIKPPGLLLLDSGGQYTGGTTDITRTMAIGKPGAGMKKNFTLVLKGHIAVARAKFGAGTAGVKIDALARQPLRDHGLDYAHGTGHGVGCFLSVHEESASLSPRGNESLKPGMFLSNEPGYYKEGAYGIRIENLVLVRKAAPRKKGLQMLEFETFTLAPIDRTLIDRKILSKAEIQWLDKYHARVFKILAPALGKDVRAWLKRQCQPV